MEFGMVGQEGLVGSSNGLASPPSDHPAKQKWSVSVGHNNGDWKATKVAKLSDDLSLNTNNSSYCFGVQQEQNMLSFSSPKLESRNLQSSAFPFIQHPSSCYTKSSGYSCNNGNVNPSMHILNGVRGPFTTSQWFELEQQALIYKYIIANEPIPSNLLMPIRRSFESAGLCNFLGGLLRPNTIGYGWGPFHLGYGNTTDPEPGRCRRTDGKKWRCSREAVPDQKYCERHMNRGRHRSRKPVEGQSGHSISGATTNKTSSNVLTMGSSTSSPVVASGGGPSNSFAINLDRSKDLLQNVHSKHLPSSLLNRFMVNKDDTSQGKQDAAGLDFLSPRICLNSHGHALSVSASAAGDFSFLTPATITSTTTTPRSSSTFGVYDQSHNCNTQSSEPINSPHSIDDRSSSLWPKLRTQTEKSQLSISIPTSDLMSSTSSTAEEDTVSPLRLSQELNLVQTGLGVGPTSWETSSMGGPLGEVLKTTICNNISGSPQLAASPTGVLQRTAQSALGYFSNSSAGSSPRAENARAHDNIGFTLGSSSF